MSIPIEAVSAAVKVSAALPLIEQSLTTIITGEIIEQASGPVAQLAKAQMILTLTSSLIAMNNGQSTGVSGLQTSFLALVSGLKDEAVVMTLNGLFAAFLTKVQGYEASGSLLGKVGAVIANDFLQYVQTTSQAYVTHLTPA